MALVQHVQHQGTGRSFESPLDEILHQSSQRLISGREGAVDEGTALGFAGQKALVRHRRQETGHRGIMAAALLVEHLPDLTHRTGPSLPEDFEDLQFSLSGLLGFRSRHVSYLCQVEE